MARAMLLAIALASATTARGDDRGAAVMREALRTLCAAKTLTADLTTTIRNGNSKAVIVTGPLRLMKPNYLSCQLAGDDAITLVADGAAYYLLWPAGHQYMKLGLATHPNDMQGNWRAEVNAFYVGDKCLNGNAAAYTGEADIDGVRCDRVRVKLNPADVSEYYIGRADHLIRRAVHTDASHSVPNTLTNDLRHIRINGALQVAQFRFVPPADAKLSVPGGDQLLAVGTVAPDFELATPDGGRTKLAQLRQSAKAVLINFWFYG